MFSAFSKKTTRVPPHTHSHLFAIVCDRGKDSPKRLKTHGNVQKVSGKEEVVIVTQNWHGHVPSQVQERLQAHAHTHIHTV